MADPEVLAPASWRWRGRREAPRREVGSGEGRRTLVAPPQYGGLGAVPRKIFFKKKSTLKWNRVFSAILHAEMISPAMSVSQKFCRPKSSSGYCIARCLYGAKRCHHSGEWKKHIVGSLVAKCTSRSPHRLFLFFYPRYALRRAGLWDSDVSVWLSVCHSRYCIKTGRASVMVSSTSDSPMISLSGEYDSSKNSEGVTPSDGDLWEWGGFEQAIIANFLPIRRHISEKVQDTTKVTIEH